MSYCDNVSYIIIKLISSFNYFRIYKSNKYSINERDLEENISIHSKQKLISLKNNINYNNYTNDSLLSKKTNKILIEYDDGTFTIGTQLFNDKYHYQKKEV